MERNAPGSSETLLNLRAWGAQTFEVRLIVLAMHKSHQYYSTFKVFFLQTKHWLWGRRRGGLRRRPLRWQFKCCNCRVSGFGRTRTLQAVRFVHCGIKTEESVEKRFVFQRRREQRLRPEQYQGEVSWKELDFRACIRIVTS